MFKNFYKVAIRNFSRHRFFSFINIISLAIGISAALVIFLYVSYDFSFDKFQRDNGRIYRIVSAYRFNGETFPTAGVPYPLYNAVTGEIPGIETASAFRLWPGGYRGIKISVKKANGTETAFRKQEHIIFADENYFKLISYKWLSGTPKAAMQKPLSVVLTASNAALYFPGVPFGQLAGREIYFNDTVRMVVTGVVKDIKVNTDFTFKTFVARASLQTQQLMPDEWQSWTTTNPESQLCIKLQKGETAENINRRLVALSNKYDKENIAKNIGVTYTLQPLNNIHFNATYNNYNTHVASKPVLYSLLAVAGFLLLLGCVNFINLATAQASRRAKEIGIRKTMGSSLKQLMLLFLGETFLLTLLATVLSIALTPLFLQVFAGLFPPGFHVDFSMWPRIALVLAGLVVLVSFLAGIYPALVLSSFKPVDVLKNQSAYATGKTRGTLLRKGLTAFQFVIAEILVIGTVVVAQQLRYTLTADMGFNKDAVIYFGVNYGDNSAVHKPLISAKLQAIPGVEMVSLSNTPASFDGGIRGDAIAYDDGEKTIKTNVKVELADTNYVHLYQLTLLAGSNLPAGDTIKSAIINQTCAAKLGFTNPQDAIGKYVQWHVWGKKQVPITGVVKDFHLRSLHEEVKPMIISTKTDNQECFSVRLRPQTRPGAWQATIQAIANVYKEVYPEDVFEYHFVDDTIEKYYTTEKNTAKLLAWATALCIIVSCLGLLGLAMYTITMRTKEMGVRKVLGAKSAQLAVLLSKDFLTPVVAAVAIAIPVAWIGIHQWLQGFAYRVQVHWWVFAAAAIFSVLLALATISYQAIKAVRVNPVKSLRAD